MACEHKRLRCTNGEFFCLDCGAKVEIPVYQAEHADEPAEKPKRKTVKKGAAKE